MKKLSHIIALVLVSAFIFASCDKYEEGPKFSLATKKARLTNKWKIESAYTNGTSVSLTSEDTNGYIEFKKDGSVSYVYTIGNTTATTDGKWEFYDGKEELRITTTYGGVSTTVTYNILRLKSKELWLEEEGEFDFEYETHYVPYED